MTEHIQARSKLKGMNEIKTFNDLLDRCILSTEERTLLELHYLQNKDLRYISDVLGYSEGAIKKKHRRVLRRINQIL